MSSQSNAQYNQRVEGGHYIVEMEGFDKNYLKSLEESNFTLKKTAASVELHK